MLERGDVSWVNLEDDNKKLYLTLINVCGYLALWLFNLCYLNQNTYFCFS